MQRAMDETNRRRELQLAYNKTHGITPATIQKAIRRGIEEEIDARRIVRDAVGKADEKDFSTQEFLNELEAEMLSAAQELDFERAAQLRDRILKLKQEMGQSLSTTEMAAQQSKPQRGKPRKSKKGSGKGLPEPFKGNA